MKRDGEERSKGRKEVEMKRDGEERRKGRKEVERKER